VSSRRNTFLQMLRRVSENLPTKAVVYRLYGSHADVRFGSSPSVVRNVEILGNAGAIKKGTVVLVYWQKQPGRYGKTPVILATEEAASLDNSGIPHVDGRTIVYGEHGLEVPRGGISLAQLGFVPSLAGHTHSDPLQEFGWHITNDGVLFVQDTFIHPSGQISLGKGSNVIKLDSIHPTYRIWAGDLDPSQAPFSVQKDGSLSASKGQVAGWSILTSQLSNNNAHLDASGFIRLGAGNEIVELNSQNDTYRIWAGHGDPAQAPFSVTKGGAIKATAGLLAGFNIHGDRIVQGDFEIDAAGKIKAGTGPNIAVLDVTNQEGWRF
jgi:hypothetical protein